eukprot:CAMPEP_0202835976 /NCGR_PEP_ID=MMETSP1389-20130828/39232_1 /ASSEMBLY_ACC=CAM_ASM_000865 /TAXON_ID=302021 /ORGANISM="Rhodomonas sp., Strain CCMP768" /LENGTH=76 /DNA_ID=CAMNT_0049511633 /DNA_START=155 /DNA_END=382 /DNA_ORIENTATION=+
MGPSVEAPSSLPLSSPPAARGLLVVVENDDLSAVVLCDLLPLNVVQPHPLRLQLCPLPLRRDAAQLAGPHLAVHAQ